MLIDFKSFLKSCDCFHNSGTHLWILGLQSWQWSNGFGSVWDALGWIPKCLDASSMLNAPRLLLELTSLSFMKKPITHPKKPPICTTSSPPKMEHSSPYFSSLKSSCSLCWQPGVLDSWLYDSITHSLILLTCLCVYSYTYLLTMPLPVFKTWCRNTKREHVQGL